MAEVVQVVGTFAAMAALCTLLEKLWPLTPAAPRWRPGSRTDVWYNVIRVVLSAAAAVATGAAAATLPEHAAPPAPVGRLPFAAQLVLFLFLSDLIQYWSHRWMHVSKRMWHLHAVHHSPERIDWLVAARVHPLELAVNKAVSALPLYLAGFAPGVVAVAVPLAAAYSLVIHSNLRWTYGPVGYVITSPAFHHWHHASDEPARDKNFAQTFAFIDYLFGTAYFPRGAAPERYGLVSGEMPDGIVPQFLQPLREWRRMLRERYAPPAADPGPAPTADARPELTNV